MTRIAVDLDEVSDKAGLMDRVADALALPDWFGRNWDALADSLCDHTVWPEGAPEEGLEIVVRNWRPYAKGRPDEWETAVEVFDAAVDRTPTLSVVLALGGAYHQPGHQSGL